jgi:hypothetical protein
MNVAKANRVYNRKFSVLCERYFVAETITEDEFIQKWDKIRAKLNRQKYEAAGIRD